MRVLGWLWVVALVGGCTSERDGVARLREQFTVHAPTVLGEHGSEVLARAPDGSGFVARPAPAKEAVAAAAAALGRRRGLQAVFPAAGDGGMRFTLADGFTFGAREVGARGSGRVHGGALVYDHGDGAGASFWSAIEDGYEEWLLLPAAGAAAHWMVTGATLRQRGAAVEVVDDAGTARVTVTAPAAWAESGAPVRARLAAEGARLALTVEGATGAGMVLVDPVWQVTGPVATARQDHTATRRARPSRARARVRPVRQPA